MTRPDDEYDPSLDDPDDSVIGVVFWWSIAALAVIALAVVGIRFWMGRGPDEAPVAERDAVPALHAEAEVSPPRIPFRDVTESAGIDFVHTSGAVGEKLLPETMGGGCAFTDIDRDGDPDLLLINGTNWDGQPGAFPAVTLYLNDGQGAFRDASAEWGLDDHFYGMGVACGDVDADGDPDVYVTAVGSNRLYRNDGDRLVDITEASGAGGSEAAWSTAAGFFDADRDGDLDLLVGNYVKWSPEIDREVDFRLTGLGRAYGPPTNFAGDHLVYYANDGRGRFADRSEAAGVRITNPATGEAVAKALAFALVDLDSDGWMDVVVANDTVANFALRNRGDGTFEEIGGASGVAYDGNGKATGAMGIDAAFHRNDDNLGIAIGNFANEMTSLYVRQDLAALFVDEAITEGVGAPSRSALTFGLFFADVDLDGRLDLLQVNGHIEDEIEVVQASQRYAQPAQLFWNGGDETRRRFVEMPADLVGDLSTPLVGRGAAYADVDADGDLDILVTQIGGAPALFRNDQDTGHHFLRVELDGMAIGAWVELEADGLVQRRAVAPTRSYLSQVEPTVTFGLGAATSIDRLTVEWPSGHTQSVTPSGIDRTIRVTEAP